MEMCTTIRETCVDGGGDGGGWLWVVDRFSQYCNVSHIIYC